MTDLLIGFRSDNSCVIGTALGNRSTQVILQFLPLCRAPEAFAERVFVLQCSVTYISTHTSLERLLVFSQVTMTTQTRLEKTHKQNFQKRADRLARLLLSLTVYIFLCFLL